MADIINNVITKFKTIMTGLRNLQQTSNAMKTVGNSAKRGSVALKTLTAASNGLNTPLTVTARSFQKANLSILAGGKIMQNTTGKILDLKQAMREVNKSNRQFQMGFLSMMFAAMALNRVLGTFIRGAIEAYAKASGETNNFRKETNKLVASWEFFKFSLIDALSKSELFISMVGWLTNLVNWFNRLTPAAKSFIMLSAGFLFILSLFIMIVGQIGLAKGGFEVLGDIGATIFSKRFIPMMGKFLIKMITVTALILMWVALFIVLRSFFFGFSKGMDDWLASMQRSGGIVTKIILGIVRVLHLGGAVIRMIFLNILDVIVMVFQGILNVIISGINLLIRALNRVPGVSIPLVPKVDFGAFDRIKKRTTELALATPTLSNLFTGGSEPTGGNTSTTVDKIDINIEGSGQNASEIADEVMEKLNRELNLGLDSSNI